MGEDRRETRRRVPWWRPVLLVVLVVGLGLAAWKLGLGKRLPELQDWIRARGAWAPLVFIAVRALVAVAVVPGSALSGTAGVLFGSVVGVLCVSAGTTIGACASFLIARYFARGAVEKWLAGRRTFQRVEGLLERHGALVVALNRLLPVIPFQVQNYGFGLTSLPFGTYLFWSWLCMLPGNILVVVAADIGTKTLLSGQVPWALVWVLGVTLLIVLVLVVMILLRLRSEAKRGED